MNVTTSFTKNKIVHLLPEGKISCSAPSNIALVKYWGKYPVQQPANPSISFTLDQSKTITTLYFKEKEIPNDNFEFELLFEGIAKPEFLPKLESFFSKIEPFFEFLKQYHFKIETRNTFPHSSGIASSASSMSALAYCLTTLEAQICEIGDQDYILKKTSFIARLGSGSACRSINGPMMVWGTHEGIKESTNLYAVPFPFTIHDHFKNYQDTILLVDKGKKEVSSTVGHQLMHEHPYAESRFKQAYQNITRITEILTSGNKDAFIHLVESEALTLHAMMMTSMPYFILMKANTLLIIQKIWEYRKNTGSSVCFTLDAGANVHVLYPENEQKVIKKFIESELVAYCENGNYICDKIGFGIELL
ncbi:diphosphomevalonate decarboxylase [Aquimarina sp. ERC-38]|uniref:diphosphomevalonate/mevalonate 3,5-bisphosphate decarboxylase family protein n=1 Tax=Aquimarina sp. ERC-38 TaxID=2949996 RepID=UPI00224743EB|nr:diphosphomevalonate decarboxylase [Aquimarina sp. ERC-38]UZO81503.1 diphosphomevalonate decarboxylase [Aquimarina sp. ERC-38]